MKYLPRLVILVIVGLMPLYAYADDYDFTPGLWESTVTVEFKGIPDQMASMMKIPIKTESICLRKDDLMFKTDNQCTYEKNRISKNKMKIDITCNTPQGVTKGSGEINFTSKSSSGWIEMNVPGGSMGPMTMKSNFNSKYIGACK